MSFGHQVLGFGGGNAVDYGDDFVLVIRIDIPYRRFTLPSQSVGGTFDATIDWGDGSSNAVTAWNDTGLVHEYIEAGDYLVRISGSFPNLRFAYHSESADRVIKILNFGDVGFIYLAEAFYDCSNLNEVTWTSHNFSAVTNMDSFFEYCGQVTSVDVTGWDVSNATALGAVFSLMGALVEIKGLDTWSTDSMTDMAWFCRDTDVVTLDLTSFDVSGCAVWTNAFRNNDELISIDTTGWVTTAMTTLNTMFESCAVLEEVIGMEDWDISGVSSFLNMLVTSQICTERYDAVLIGWEAQSVVPSLTVEFGGSKYTAGGAAEAARTALEASPNFWTINDGGEYAIPSGMLMHFSANDLSTLWQDDGRTTAVTSHNDPVGAWDDKSGNGHHVYQATADKRPLYKTDFNTDQKSVWFDGINDALASTLSNADAKDFTIFAVVQTSAADAGGHYFLDVVFGRMIWGMDSDVGEFGYYNNGGWQRADVLPSTPTVVTMRLDSTTDTSGKVSLNQAESVSDGEYIPDSFNGSFAIGSRYSANQYYWDDYISEIIVYEGNLTEYQIRDVENHLALEYGITL